MKFLLLRLKGPMQSWASKSRFSVRDSGDFPSMSGVFGLFGSAMGYTRDDSDELLELLSPLTMAVRIDEPGRRMRDYQIIDIGNGKKISERFYLSDANFFVAVYDPEQNSDSLLERLAQSLDFPENTLFLGRKSCPPGEKINLGVHEYEAIEKVLESFYTVQSGTQKPVIELKAWIPGNSGRHAQLVQDVPLSFSTTARSHSTRLISQIKIQVKNPDAVSFLDPFDMLQED